MPNKGGVSKHCIYIVQTIESANYKGLQVMQKEIEKISLSKSRGVLEKDGSKYSNEEILEIREFLYKIAELDYEVFLKQKIREKEFEEAKQNHEMRDLKQAA